MNDVLVGLDPSGAGKAALAYAAEVAEAIDVRLVLVRAFEPTQYFVRPSVEWQPGAEDAMRNAAQRLLDEAVELLHVGRPQLEVVPRLELGWASETLIDLSREAGTVVVGSRGAGGFAGMLLGSTALHVASHAHCPVVAVPPAEGGVTRSGVVVGVDGSQLSEAAIEYAFRTASRTGEPLLAVHAWTDPAQPGVGPMFDLVYDRAAAEEQERLAMAESMAGWQEKFPDVAVEVQVVNDHPVHALTVAGLHARLVVVGSRGRGTLRSVVLGSVSHGVLHHASGPVAIIRVES